MEKEFDSSDAVRRMEALNPFEMNDFGAKGFSEGLPIPENVDNLNGISGKACFLASLDTGETVCERNACQRMYPASITKLMSAIVASENADFSKELTVPDLNSSKVSGSSTANLQKGDILSVEQLVTAMLIPSGNDAAEALSIGIAGSEEEFVRLMNEKALELGCTGTHFQNPHGLPEEGHFTSAYDIFLILRAALKDEKLIRILSLQEAGAEYRDSKGAAKGQIWQNSNQFITGTRTLPDGIRVLGGKTGTTKEAGYCLSMGFVNGNDEKFAAVVLNASSKSNLYDDMEKIVSLAID